MTVKELPFTQWASIHRTDRGISVEPLSGYSIVQREDEGYVIYLPPDATDDALGRALLEALDKSRFIWPPDPKFSEAARYMRCYRNWQKDFMRRFGHKTKRDAYKTMDWCEAERSEDRLSIEPHKRIKPEQWKWLSPDMTVVIPATTHAATAGAALRRALDRCGDADIPSR
jgi:CDI immunity protein